MKIIRAPENIRAAPAPPPVCWKFIFNSALMFDTHPIRKPI
jgi:hypothetical protein